jgi:hypothetical protein
MSSVFFTCFSFLHASTRQFFFAFVYERKTKTEKKKKLKAVSERKVFLV